MNIPALAALVLVLGGGAAWARDSMPMLETRETKQWGVTHHEKGIVVAVDAVKGKLRVRDMQGKMRTFSAMKAKIDVAGGKTLSLADISIGDEVTVSYQGRTATAIFRLHKAAKK